MPISVIEITRDQLAEYAAIPSCFLVRSILRPELLDGGLGGIRLKEQPVPRRYERDCDAYGEQPTDWPAKFDVTPWGFFLATWNGRPVGGCAVACGSKGVFMLEDRSDLSVLWDIRVLPEARGAGIKLFKAAAEWPRARGCKQMKIETQNVNVRACMFYQCMGAHLGEIRLHGYAADPRVATR